MTTAPIADMAAAAERNVIASCLVDAAAVERCHATGLTAADFWILRARYTYGAIRAVAGTLGADGVNRVTVGYELAQRPADDGTQRTQIEVVTLAWLSQLEDDLVTSVGAEWYAGIVREQAQRRRLEAATEQVARLAASGDPDAARKAAALMAGVAGVPATVATQPRAAFRSQPAETLVGVVRARTAVVLMDDAFSCWCGAEAVAYDSGERAVCVQHAPSQVFA